MKRVVRRFLRVIGWITVSILGLILLAYILIQVPAVQNYARKKVVVYLETTLKTKVEIGRVSISFPKKIVLEDVYFEDQQKDTLLAAKRLRVDIPLLKILDNKVYIKHFELEGARANIYRVSPDTAFNYEYILKAFATQSTTPADTTAVPMQFDLDKIILNNVVTTYRDDVTGMDMYLNIGNFNSKIDTLDIYKLIYSIPTIALENSVVKIKQYKPLIEPKPMAVVEAETKPPVFDLRFKELDLKNVKFSYDNAVSAISTDLNIGSMEAEMKSISMDSLSMYFRNVRLNNTESVVVMGKTLQSEITVKEVGKKLEAQANNPWKISIDNISLYKNDFRLENNNMPKTTNGMDYGHMHIQDLGLVANDVHLTPTTYEAHIDQLALREKSGFVLHEMNADFIMDETHMALENFHLTTDRTELKHRAELRYASLEALAANPGNMFLNLEIIESNVAISDILIFAPQLRYNPPFKGYEHEVVYLDATVNGMLKDLLIPNFTLNGLGNSAVTASGRIIGLPDPDNTFYDLKIARVSTTRNDLKKILPAKAIPPTVRIPEALNGRGTFRGKLTDFTTQLYAQTNRGAADISLTMKGERLKARTALYNFDLGYVLMQPDVGRATLHADITANGFDVNTSPIDIKAYVSSINYNKYNYNNIKVDATIRNGILTAKGDANDANADLSFAVTSDLKQESPSLDLSLNVDSLNLKALGFSNLPFKINGNINISMPSLQMTALEGNATITDLVLTKDGKNFVIDSMNVVATTSPTGNTISVRSELGYVDLKGFYNLTEIGYAVQNIVHRYYKLPGYNITPLTTPQDWTMTATVFPSPILFEFVPSIKNSDTLHLLTYLNTTANDLDIEFRTAKLILSGQSLDSLTVTAGANGNSFDYSATALGGGTKDIRFYRTSVTGNLMNDLLTVRLDVKDKRNASKYQIAGVAASIPGGFKFSLSQDSLMLNYEKWIAGANNFIQYSNGGWLVNNFSISNQQQVLKANSTSNVINSPIQLDFTNFEIGTLTRVANQDSLLMSGTINGNALIRNLSSSPIFTADVQVKDFTFKGDSLGTVTAKINNETANTLAADITVLSDKNDVHLAGRYFISSGEVDMRMDVNKVDLTTLRQLTSAQLRDIGGSLNGSMVVSGKLSQPKFDGTIKFDSTFIAPLVLGEKFTLPNKEIRITSEGFALDNFVITDSSGNKATIDGSIVTTNFTDFDFDFYITSDNFRIVNTPKAPNKLFYGKLNVDLDLAVYGDMKSPTLEGNIRANEETNFSVVLPGQDPEVIKREGVVRFVDLDIPEDSIYATTTNIFDTIANSLEVGGLDLAATIETDTAAQFNLVVDERNGDVLSMRGRADISAGMDKSGKISLTGNYELNSGAYQLTLNFLKRKFDILPGSVVTWTGDPTTATLNVRAQYSLQTAPINLVYQQIAGRAETELNIYKERVPFNVILRLSGELMQPTVGFDIQLPENYTSRWREVEERLQQIRTDDAELNKQVFSLLILGRFVQENPFENQADRTSVGSIVRQSVSRILTEQLNNWAVGFVNGLDVSTGIIYSDDYSTGQRQNRTDMLVTLSKRLLDNRIRVSVGSNFQIEGPNNPVNRAAGFASDVALDYLLTPDGRYILRAYRRNVYEAVLEGQVV